MAHKKELVKFVPSFAYSFITFLMSASHMPGSGLGIGEDIVVKKKKKKDVVSALENFVRRGRRHK